MRRIFPYLLTMSLTTPLLIASGVSDLPEIADKVFFEELESEITGTSTPRSDLLGSTQTSSSSSSLNYSDTTITSKAMDVSFKNLPAVNLDRPESGLSAENGLLQNNLHQVTSVASSPFKEKETLRDQNIAEFEKAQKAFQESEKAHQIAITNVLEKERKTIFRKIAAPFEALAKPLRNSLPETISPAREELAITADQLRTSYDHLGSAAADLGFQDPDELLNQAEYSEKRISLGETDYPTQGTFILGKEVRDELQAVQQHHLLQLLQTSPGSAQEEALYNEMMRDFGRATFILKTPSADTTRPPKEEFLYNYKDEEEVRKRAVAYKEAAVSALKDEALSKFKAFVGENRAFQLSIGSLMYQRGAADLQYMKWGHSRDEKNGLGPYYTSGLQSVSELQGVARSRPGTMTEERLLYSLEKISSPVSDDSYQLVIFYSRNEARIHMVTEQEFSLHTTDILIYRFEKNPSFRPNAELSDDNLPVIITCDGGQLLHELASFEGEQSVPLDPISLSIWEGLTPKQQTAVTAYQEAESKYLAEKSNWTSRLSYLGSRSIFGSLISSEKLAVKDRLKSLRNVVQDAAVPVAKDPATISFLERNVITPDTETITLPSLSDGNKLVPFPTHLSFEGGKPLQQATSEQLKKPFTACFLKRSDEAALTAAAKKITFKTAGQSDASFDGMPDAEAYQELLNFAENNTIASAVALLVQNPTHSITQQLLQEPSFGDALHLLPEAKAYFSLEKKMHDSSKKPFFILTAEYRLQRTYKKEADADKFSRTLNVRFIYGLKINPLWDDSKFPSLKNPPVETSCLGIHIDQGIEPAF